MNVDRTPAQAPDDSASSARISPTAHYTGYTWLAHGLSHPALATTTGRALYRALAPANRALAALGRPNLDGMLLARHRLIDALLDAAITRGEIGQVIEVACGLSPRGHRFVARHGDRVTYVEADLPAMAARKREALARAGAAHRNHRVVEVDATADHGPRSLAAIAATLDPGRGTAILTEGLVNYFPPDAVAGMWGRFARVLGGFPRGRYLSDLHLGGTNPDAARAFAGLLGVFVRGRVHFHFANPTDATRGLEQAGFTTARLLAPAEHEPLTGPVDRPSARYVHIIDARVGTPPAET